MIGIDFGGTRIKIGIVASDRVVRSTVVETPIGAAPSEIFDLMAQAVRSLAQGVTTVGLAIPGEVDAEGRCWRLPNVPGFEGIHIASELSQRLAGARVVVENDATSAALAEHLYGHGRAHESFLMVTLGTGVGGGLVVGGQLRRGANGFAGEIGHVRVESGEAAWPCGCGQRGCMEAYAGTDGLLRRFTELGGHADEIAEVAALARRGDVPALNTFRSMGAYLGLGLSSIQNVLDLDAVVFSGGISGSFDLVEPSLRESLERHAFSAPLAAVPLLVSELGERAGIVGVAHLPGPASAP